MCQDSQLHSNKHLCTFTTPTDTTGRWAGKQFTTVPLKEGRGAEVYLDKCVRSLAEVGGWVGNKAPAFTSMQSRSSSSSVGAC